MLQNNSNRLSLLAWAVSVLVLVVAAFFYPKWTFEGTESVLSWDVFGYYLYLPSLFIYNDLGGVAFLDGLMAQYGPATSNYHAIPLESGQHIMKYSMGQSIFYLPFFFIAHIWAKLSSYPADGLSYPYQFSIFWGAVCYALAGLWLLRKVLLCYFNDTAVAVTLLLLVLATNYLNYVSYDAAMTHNHLFSLYAALLYLTLSWHQRPTWLKGAGIGFLCGLAALTRPTEIICVLVPMLWGVYNLETLKAKWRLLVQYKWHYVGAVFVAALVGSLQLIYWKYYSGHWLFYSYEEQGFSFLRPHIINGLFSFKKGWLVYTPIMVFAVMGLVPLYRSYKTIFWAVLVFSALNVYITFSWDIWWYGGSFGARAMVQSYALWLLPFAAFVQWALRRRWIWLPLAPLVAIFIWLNLFQTYQCHGGEGLMYTDGLTAKYWFEVFVKQKRGKDLHKFLDLPFEAPHEDYFAEKKLLLQAIPKDLAEGFGDRLLFTTGKNLNEHLSAGASLPANSTNDWVRASANIYYRYMEWDEWKMARLGIRFYKDGQEIGQKNTRLQWIFDAETWYRISVEIPINQNRAGADSIAVYMENPGQALYADTISVEFMKAK